MFFIFFLILFIYVVLFNFKSSEMLSLYMTIIVILLIVLFYMNFENIYKEFFTLTSVRSTIDNEYYPVVASYSDKELAANNIGHMNIFSLKLLSKLKELYLESKSNPNNREHSKGKVATHILLKRFSTDSFKENDSDDPTKTSFTTDKGRIIALCLREKESGQNKLHDLKVLKFVLLHELAHIITKEYDHNRAFWANFKFLLQFCKKYNLYDCPNYSTQNAIYCGMRISYGPQNDPKLPSFFDDENEFMSS